MEPTTTTAIAKGLGGLGSGVLNRYRPIGVARLGSPEDRGQSYRRFLDAVNAAHFMMGHHMAAGKAAQDAIRERWYLEYAIEAACALDAVRLCAPEYVIRAAEDAYDAIPYVAKTEDDFLQESVDLQLKEEKFIEAARHDLNFTARKWQVWRRRKAKKYQEQAVSAGIPLPAPPSVGS